MKLLREVIKQVGAVRRVPKIGVKSVKTVGSVKIIPVERFIGPHTIGGQTTPRV